MKRDSILNFGISVLEIIQICKYIDIKVANNTCQRKNFQA